MTGATGFIGNHLVTALRQRGDDVVCATRRPVVSEDLGIQAIVDNLLQPAPPDKIKDQCGSLDAVFHLAAAMPDEPGLSDADYLAANGHATTRYLETARALGATHFVYISSLSVLGDPVQRPITERTPVAPATPYAASKLAGEMACEKARQDGMIAATSLRITSPYGSGMKPTTVLPRFVAQALRGETLHWFGTGRRAQDFVHVDDVVSACLLASATNSPGVYNIGTGRPTAMRALAEMIASAVPGGKAVADGRPDPQEGMVWQVDVSSAKISLGYEPKVTIEAGLLAYLNEMRTPNPARSWWRRP